MSCLCIPCSARNNVSTPNMVVRTTRAADLERNVWALVFRNFDYQQQMVASAVCKRWRHILSKTLLTSPNYKIGSFKCFKSFYKDFLKSRHIILFDASGSMQFESRIVKASLIASKLLDFIEPVIRSRGIFIGSFGDSSSVQHVKTRPEVIAYIHDISIHHIGSDFNHVSRLVYEKLSILKAKLNTHVHVISDMGLDNEESIINFSLSSIYSKKVTFHFYDLQYDPMKIYSFISRLRTVYESRKDNVVIANKRRKLKDQLEINVYPLSTEAPTTEVSMDTFQIVLK